MLGMVAWWVYTRVGRVGIHTRVYIGGYTPPGYTTLLPPWVYPTVHTAVLYHAAVLTVVTVCP